MDERLERFVQLYKNQAARWDTGITPPEIVAITAELPAGKAIDLGCGTGTNVRYLLEKGWIADGVDFVPQAIEMAAEKLQDFPQENYRVMVGDVTQLNFSALRPPYDLAVDIGCGHATPAGTHEKYAHDVAALVKPGGTFMLYVHFPSEGHHFQWGQADVHSLFTPYFEIVSEVISTDTTNGTQSAWFRMTRKDR